MLKDKKLWSAHPAHQSSTGYIKDYGSSREEKKLQSKKTYAKLNVYK